MRSLQVLMETNVRTGGGGRLMEVKFEVRGCGKCVVSSSASYHLSATPTT